MLYVGALLVVVVLGGTLWFARMKAHDIKAMPSNATVPESSTSSSTSTVPPAPVVKQPSSTPTLPPDRLETTFELATQMARGHRLSEWRGKAINEHRWESMTAVRGATECQVDTNPDGRLNFDCAFPMAIEQREGIRAHIKRTFPDLKWTNSKDKFIHEFELGDSASGRVALYQNTSDGATHVAIYEK